MNSVSSFQIESHPVVSHEEWLDARIQLQAAEKRHTREHDLCRRREIESVSPGEMQRRWNEMMQPAADTKP